MHIIYTNAPASLDTDLVRKTTLPNKVRIGENDHAMIRRLHLKGTAAQAEDLMFAYIRAGYMAMDSNPDYDARMEELENMKRFVASANREVLEDALLEYPQYEMMIMEKLDPMREALPKDAPEEVRIVTPPLYIYWDGKLCEKQRFGYTDKVFYKSLMADEKILDAISLPRLAQECDDLAIIEIAPEKLPPAKVMRAAEDASKIWVGLLDGVLIWRVENDGDDTIFGAALMPLKPRSVEWENTFDETPWMDYLTWIG